MRRLARILIGLGGALALLLGAAWLLPPLWDWSRQRETMEAFAGLALGRTVRIEGAIGLTLLPEPMLTATGVRVLGDVNAGELRIRSLRLGVVAGELLRGRVVARELVLGGAELLLPWPPPGTSEKGRSAPGLATPALSVPAWYVGFGGRVEGGRISLGGLRIQDIQISVNSSDDGVLRLSGRMGMPWGGVGGGPGQIWPGQIWDISARLGQPGADGTATLDATLGGRGRLAGTSLTFTGRLGGEAGLAGQLRAQGPDLSRLMAAPALAFRAEGPWRAGADAWAWDKVALELGGLPAEATLRLDLGPRPVLRAALRAARLDLDGWGPVLARAPDLASELATEIDVRAEVAGLAGGIVRDLRLALVAEEGNVRLREAAFTAPGGAALRLSGTIAAAAEGPEFSGRIDLRAPDDPRSFDPDAGMRWLVGAWGGGAPPEFPAGVARRAMLGGALRWAPGRLALSGLSGRIDDSQVSGDLRWQSGARPGLRVSLVLDTLVLDPWLTGGTSPAGWALPGWLAADVQLRVGTLWSGGQPVEGAELDALLEPDRLLLRRLEGRAYPQQAGGVRILASGAMGPGGRIADGRLEMSAETAAPLAAWIPERWRGTPDLWDGDLWAGALALRAEFAGPPEALAMQVAAELGDARLEAQPVWNTTNGRLGLRLGLRHPGAARFLAALGMPGKLPLAARTWSEGPGWPGEGSFALQARLAVQGEEVTVEDFDVTAGALRASGRGRGGWRDDAIWLDGQVNAETLPLPWAHPDDDARMNVVLPQGWQGNVRLRAARVLADDAVLAEGLACALSLEARVLRLADCAARWAEGGMAIAAVLDGAADPPSWRLDGVVSGARIDGFTDRDLTPAEGAIDLRAARADISLTLRGAGNNAASLLASLSGQIEARAADVTWLGFDLAAAREAMAQARARPTPETELAVRTALGGGMSHFATMEMAADVRDGALVLGQLRGEGASGIAHAAGAIRLRDRDIDLRLLLQPALVGQDADMPALSLALRGPMGGPRRISDPAAALRWLAEPLP